MEHQKKYRSLSDLAELADLEQLPVPRSVIPGSQKQKHDGKGNIVHLSLDTHGRKGKSVTIISGLHHNPGSMEDIARILKQFCGTGGTVKEGKIELQGDQRARAAEKLKEMNYLVK
jgi:translation initiation factor 1